MTKSVLFLAILLALAPVAAAQPPEVRLRMSGSLREALDRSGFDDGIRTNDGPDLDRRLTSSAFGTSSDTFVAGYYFQDELDGQGLGPLHVSLFDRSRRTWVHKANISADVERLGLMAGGSVLGVIVTPKTLLLDTHFSPSAGFTIVLDRSLNVVTSLRGYRPRVTGDGSIWYLGDMVHFADSHQETLRLFDLGRKEEVEVFPGATLSPLAAAYQRKIRTIYAKLPANQRDPSFDRDIQEVAERDSSAFAFIVGYRSDYLDGSHVDHPRLTTIARCDRRSRGRWSCTEQEIRAFARGIQFSLTPDADGRYTSRDLDALAQAALKRRP